MVDVAWYNCTVKSGGWFDDSFVFWSWRACDSALYLLLFMMFCRHFCGVGVAICKCYCIGPSFQKKKKQKNLPLWFLKSLYNSQLSLKWRSLLVQMVISRLRLQLFVKIGIQFDLFKSLWKIQCWLNKEQ